MRGTRSHAALAGTAIVLALFVMTGAASASTIDKISGIGSLVELSPGPDGLLWGIEYDDDADGDHYAVVRFEGPELVTRTPLPHASPPFSVAPWDSNGMLHPMPDGSMTLVEARSVY
jgi:hypothetical protein